MPDEENRKSAAALWSRALLDLSQCFDRRGGQWLKNNTRATELTDEMIVVAVPDETIRARFTGVLADQIKMGAAAVVGLSRKIDFVVAPEEFAPPALNGARRGRDDPVDDVRRYLEGEHEKSEVKVVTLNPLIPFVAVPHYAIRFWLPYLGALPFNLWLTLRSYGFFIRDGGEWPSIAILVDTVGSPATRSNILGRAAAAGRASQEGALQTLIDQRIAKHAELGRGRNTRHIFEVIDDLPLLSPSQVATLSERKRIEHADFFGFFKGFDAAAWKQIDAASLIGKW